MTITTDTFAITRGDGTVLHAATPVELAWQWAQASYPADQWQTMSVGQRAVEVAAALDALKCAEARHA